MKLQPCHVVKPGLVTRRGFLQGARAAAMAGGLMAGSSAPAAAGVGPIRRICHFTIDAGKNAACDLEQQGGIGNFGKGEVAVIYRKSPLNAGANATDVVLRRSLDGGQTWLADDESAVWSERFPVEKQREFLCRDPGERSVLDMSRPEAMFFFGRSRVRLTRSIKNTKLGWTCERKISGVDVPPSTVFQLRSVDKGRTWERVPLVLDPPEKTDWFARDNRPLVRMPDGSLVAAIETGEAVWLYGTENQGMTWQWLSRIAAREPGVKKPCCSGLVLLPGGRLQCFLRLPAGRRGTLAVSTSADGFRWSQPRPIAEAVGGAWPLRLRDGRLVIIYASLHPPAIAAIVSTDEGDKWSRPAVIREGPGGLDTGAPVATELDDGRLFTAYRYPLADDGQATSLGGTTFELG